MTANPDGYDEVFTKFITLKNGRRIYASSYGLKAFRLRVRKKKKETTTSSGGKV